MDFLIGFLIGIIITVIILIIIDQIGSRTDSARLAFDLSKQNIEQELKLKKDAQEKEMTSEIQEKILSLKQAKESLEEQYGAAQKFFDTQNQELESSYNQKQKQLEQQYEKYGQELQQGYLNKTKELQDSYKKRQTDFESQELSARLQRQSETQKELEEEAKEKEKQLSALQSQFNKEKEHLSQDFLAYSEQINLKKATLDKEIQEYEDKQQKLIARFQADEKVKNERDYYKIKINSAAAQDIQKLRNLALSFNNTNAIYKLIYDVYYKAQLESLFKRVLGENVDKGGIYKITDVTTEKIYIGRAVKFLERWRTHSKRGCGIDPIKSLLYDRMMEIGLENFTWEIVEICPKEEQSEKEKYWISFYHSDSYGFNQNKGG